MHETSIYRRWGTRGRLICDALLDHSEHQLAVPDTGSVREDLAGFAASLADYLATPLGVALVHAITSAADDQALAEARALFWSTRHELASQIIDRAIARGELPANADSRPALEALLSPLHFRVLLTHQPIDESLPRQLADIVLDGIRARHPPSE